MPAFILPPGSEKEKPRTYVSLLYLHAGASSRNLRCPAEIGPDTPAARVLYDDKDDKRD